MASDPAHTSTTAVGHICRETHTAAHPRRPHVPLHPAEPGRLVTRFPGERCAKSDVPASAGVALPVRRCRHARDQHRGVSGAPAVQPSAGAQFPRPRRREFSTAGGRERHGPLHAVLGQRYVEAGAADGAMLQVVAAAAYGARRWAHCTRLFTVVTWIFVLFAALWRARLIPRVLAVGGLVTCALQITGVPLRALLGYPVVMGMAMPLGPVYAGLGPGHRPRQRGRSGPRHGSSVSWEPGPEQPRAIPPRTK